MNRALHDIPYHELETEGHRSELSPLIGQSVEMVEIKEQIRRLSGENRNVLLTGETGCGKELIARTIHFQSLRRKGPLVRMSCRDLSTEQFECVTYGIKAAYCGTLFIDGIHMLSMPLQKKLLHVFRETGVPGFDNAGTNKLDTRLMVTCSSNLLGKVLNGTFQKDLYDGLDSFHIKVSPLREKREDIPILLQFFLNKYGFEIKEKGIDIPEKVHEFCLTYPWPGNVLELQNLVRKAIVLGDWRFLSDTMMFMLTSLAT